MDDVKVEQFLSIVEDVFQITDRGCVIVPGVPIGSSVAVKVGDALRLARPDGASVSTYVAGIEMISVSPPRPHPIGLLLPKDIDKNHVPVGTQVFHISTDN